MKNSAGKWTLLAGAVLLSAGMSIPAMGASAGWVSENGRWRYMDSQGNYVSNTWQTSGNDSFYLGGDGYMVTNQWVDDTYYVNDQGAMVKNSWIHITEDGGEKEAGWYFVDSKGKLQKDGWETINGSKYSLDENGRMRTGWYFDDDDNLYYLGNEDEGYVKTGWRCLAYDADEGVEPEEGEIPEVYTQAGDGAKWFYFRSNGKAVMGENGGYKSETINGKKYYFDENGVMMSGWIAAEEDAEAGDTTGISRFVYLGGENDGVMVKNQWLELDEHPGDSDDSDEIQDSGDDEAPTEGDSQWYYFDNDGTPAYLNSRASSMSAATTKINGSSYFFNQYGCMQTGMIRIQTAEGKEMVGYFGDWDSDGKMYTGKHSKLAVDGGNYTYFFTESGSNKGAGYSGDKDGYLYYQGRLVEADDDSDYQVYAVNGDVYLVNESGKVQKDSKNYKVDGDYLYKISGGKLYYIDDDKEITGEVTESDSESLPSVYYDKEYILD